MESIGKSGLLASRLSRSLKVIQSETHRSGTYDFIFVIHSTVSGINGDIDRKELKMNDQNE